MPTAPAPHHAMPDDLTLSDEFFAIEDGPGFILYAPHLPGAVRVNGATVRRLQSIASAQETLASLATPVLDDLLGSGVVVPREPALAIDRFPTKTAYDPEGLTLVLTTRCSLACRYCYASGGDRPRVMTWDVARRGIDWFFGHTARAARPQARIMFHGGGEVTTESRLLRRCVDYVRCQGRLSGVQPSISAGLNGVMKRSMVRWVVENLDGATVSLDGLPEIHNSQRPLPTGRDSFPIVADTLHQFDDAGFQYGIRMTVTGSSVERLIESVTFACRTFNGRVIHVEPVFEVGRARVNDLGFPDPERFIAAFRAARSVARAEGRELRYSGVRFGDVTNKFCQVCDDLLVLTPDGDVTSCYEVGDRDDVRAGIFFYGRLNPSTGSIDIDEDRLQRLRTLTVEHKPSCADCFCKWTCAGECAAKLAHSGSPWDATGSPRCVINRALTLDLLRECLDLGGLRRAEATAPTGTAR